MVRSARHVVVLADSSKLGDEQLVRFAATEEVHTLVTDGEADEKKLAELRERGLEVVVA
jgi:DeoR family transcriptional regulator, fructose operon transcriptional repressor